MSNAPTNMTACPVEQHWSDADLSPFGHVATVYPEMTPEHTAAYTAVMEHAEECADCDALGG
ncbi:hypothetical protein [Streptomyces sp. NPDC088725]|uniref:hypothetical protein n=1 Tax=Streptomyces sp. NPDC088725 TaxID=3365873 RepID=UPI0037F6F749